MTITAIDPGTEQSAIIHWDGEHHIGAQILSNGDLLSILSVPARSSLVIEMVASYGMPVGREVFETCVWIGRFFDRWVMANGRTPILMYRRDVKLHLCASARAKDANIRQALIDRFGAPGVKKAQGVTYGIKSHLWAAFALAVTAWDQRNAAMALPIPDLPVPPTDGTAPSLHDSPIPKASGAGYVS